MAVLSSFEDLLPFLGSVTTADDPIAALERQGHRFEPGLKAKFRSRATPTPAQRRLWNEAARKAGGLHFTVGRQPRFASRELAPGEFEVSVGLRMSAANEVLAGFYTNGTIPETIFLDEIVPAGTLAVLQNGFRVDRPGGTIGRFQITAPPAIAPIRDGFDRVAFTIPFRLNFERISSVVTGTIRRVVTFATGAFSLSVGLIATPPPILGPRDLEIQIDLSGSSDARLQVDPSSPVQLANPPEPGEIDGLAVIIQNALQQQLADSLRLTIGARIPLPIGKLEIRDLVLITRGDALLAGIKVQGVPGTSNPDTLAPLFPNPDSNFFTRVHDEVFRVSVRNAARSGELTRIAKGTHPDAVIDGADVAFGEGTIKVMATGKIVDFCPLNVDLGFTVTTTITITLDGTQIIVNKETDQNLDDSDAVLCVITSLGLALLAALSVIVTQGLSLGSGIAATAALGVVGVLTLILEFEDEDFDLILGGGGGGNELQIVDLDDPIPGTDLLPTLTGLFLRLDESTMLMAAHLGTRADLTNTYLYIRFLAADNFGIARAMKGAAVRLMDRDLPGPAGDDVTISGGTTTTVTTTGQHGPVGPTRTTRETSRVRTPDEAFGQTTTDYAGRIRFYIPRGELASRAGQKVIKTTRLNLDSDVETTSTTRQNIPEPRPDFYFRVTGPDGSVRDTLTLTPGFFLNFESRRVGSFANPLTIAFGGVGPIVLAPGFQ